PELSPRERQHPPESAHVFER
ncbi:uncharacterized, partial [Tachysurus ichikawai]